MTKTTLSIQRLPSVMQTLGLSRSSIYLNVSAGLLPKPINLGARSIGWLQHEIQAILAARVTGKNEGAIRELVVKLEAARKDFEV